MPSRRALSAAAPIVAAVGAIGVPYGVLAEASGFPAWLTVLLSMTVFAGSSQFALVSVLGAGGSPAAAVASAALLNTRYLATGTAAARVLPGGRLRRFALAQLVVDESYVLGAAEGTAHEPDADTTIVSGALLYAGWTAGSLVGALFGQVLGDPETVGLDAALPALFVALLFPVLTDRPAVRSALAGLATAVVLTPLAGEGIALAAAAAAGLVAHRG
ncbi:MAG TPA: AzlC family ABC transporter permease [Acidimicrobiales bacterium]